MGNKKTLKSFNKIEIIRRSVRNVRVYCSSNAVALGLPSLNGNSSQFIVICDEAEVDNTSYK